MLKSKGVTAFSRREYIDTVVMPESEETSSCLKTGRNFGIRS